MQSASGGNHASCSWGEPPRPHWLPCSLAASLNLSTLIIVDY
ncbi:hypothetical protein [Moorena producens]|nr:hypothetical protein [Moorena producens]